MPAPPAPKMGFQPARPDLANKEPEWIEAEDNSFGVRILDVRPVTLGLLSMSQDPKMAENAVSYGGEDGSSFAGQAPETVREVDADLRFRAPEQLVDGGLFLPGEMEDKWAVFVHGGELVLVRSWLRKVMLRAKIRVNGDALLVGTMTGAVTSNEESPEYTRSAVDFILRTHGLDAPWPAPLAGANGVPPRTLALACMSIFGRQAHYASFDVPARDVPSRPLRVVSRLHVAVMQGDLEKAQQAVADGISSTLLDRFGFRPIHYVKKSGPLMDFLLARGASLDDVSDEGTTPLMLAVEGRRTAFVSTLLDLGVAPDAVDARGFSALHRAAEMGELDIVAALLAHGADPDLPAGIGVSPRTLAMQRNHTDILGVLPAARK